MPNINPGTFYIVATPIGHLDDITLRALETLKSVDLIVAEDTRHTRKLLQHFVIVRPLDSFHDHSSPAKIDKLAQRLLAGEAVAYVTDAGTPGISDPGFVLIRAMIAHKIPVVPIPGAVAAMVGLTASGLPMDRFAFEGFLPYKSGKRRNKLDALKTDDRTLIFYESPHRLVKSLEDMLTVLGDRRVCVCREMTKHFEEYVRGLISEAIVHFQTHPPRGEITIVLAGADA